MEPERVWFVYLLRCSDQTLYAGITTDVHRRMRAHESGKGAKYTRGRGPLELVGRAGPVTRTLALKWERELKRQPTHRKADVLARWARVCETERVRVLND